MEENYIDEIWRDVEGYEGLYKISNYGRVWSYSKKRILKCGFSGKKPYQYRKITLSRDNINKHTSIHRLVAITFIPNPNNLPCVNHKDENKLNNNVSNLEWCTYKYNSNYKTTIKRRVATAKEKGCFVGENNPFYGKHHTEETKEKISEKHKLYWENNIHPLSKQTVVDDKIFNSIRECADYLNLRRQYVRDFLNNKKDMPETLYNRGLRFAGKTMDDYICRKDFIIECEGIKYKTIVEVAKHYDVSATVVRNWLLGISCMPQKFIDLDLKYI